MEESETAVAVAVAAVDRIQDDAPNGVLHTARRDIIQVRFPSHSIMVQICGACIFVLVCLFRPDFITFFFKVLLLLRGGHYLAHVTSPQHHFQFGFNRRNLIFL